MAHPYPPLTTLIDPTPNTWDTFVRDHPRAHLLQLAAWGQLKSAYGWSATRVALADADGSLVAGAQILLRPLPARLGTMAYIPMGPLVTDDAQLVPLLDAIRQHVTRQHRAAFLKIEPGIYLEDDHQPDWSRYGFSLSPQTVQPPNTILLDLSDGAEAALARMNQGTRRKIRTGGKKGVEIVHATRDQLPAFNAMMQNTGDRNDFGVHAPDYYATAYDLFVPDDAALLLATHEGDVLAGVFVFAVGGTAWYIAGASSDVKRNLMGSYAVQWAAVEWALARGCHTYDMWGIPDADADTLEAQFQERGDGLWGVYGFKRGWGGRVVRASGAWDVVYNPLVYQAYKLALRARG